MTWRNGLCDRGHNVSPESGNIGWRDRGSGRLTRYCIQCMLDYRSSYRHGPMPNPICRRTHDLNNPANVGVRRFPRSRAVYYCVPCFQLDGEIERQPLAAPESALDSTVEEWMAYGSCVGADPLLFSHRTTREVAATRYCEHCPVRLACGQYADRYRLDGLWGGVFRLLRKNGRYSVLGSPRFITDRVNEGTSSDGT